MNPRKHKFADDELGDVLDALFGAGDGLDLETNGRITFICRLLEQMRGSDGAHDMVHGMLDTLELTPQLTPIATRLRSQLVPRRTPPGTFEPHR